MGFFSLNAFIFEILNNGYIYIISGYRFMRICFASYVVFDLVAVGLVTAMCCCL